MSQNGKHKATVERSETDSLIEGDPLRFFDEWSGEIDKAAYSGVGRSPARNDGQTAIPPDEHDGLWICNRRKTIASRNDVRF